MLLQKIFQNGFFLIVVFAIALGAMPAHAQSVVYATNIGSDTVSVIDPSTSTVKSTFQVGGRPFGVAITPDGKRAYVSTGADTSVWVIDTKTQAVITVLYGEARAGYNSFPKSLAITPDGSRVYIPVSTINTVRVVDTGTDKQIASLTVDDYPFAVAVAPDGKRAYVATAGFVTVIETATNTA